MASVDIIINTIDKGSQGAVSFARSFGNAWKDVATPLNQTLELLGKVKQFGADAFEFFERGATVNQVTESFDLMNESIFKTPGLLDDMTAAARGTISEVDAMRGLLVLTAGVGDDMANAFAESAPRLMEIAKAANKLNPTLGDTAFLYDSISTGIKRSSTLILDNLGIIIKQEEVYSNFAASIGKSTKELSAAEKQFALLNAVIEKGDVIIGQVGGNVDAQTDAYARLGVIAQETGDAIKSDFAEAIIPYLEDITESAAEIGPALQEAAAVGVPAVIDIANALPSYIEKIGEAAEHTQDFIDVLKFLTTPVRILFTYNKVVIREIKEFIDFLSGDPVIQKIFGLGPVGHEEAPFERIVGSAIHAEAAMKPVVGGIENVVEALTKEEQKATDVAEAIEYQFFAMRDVHTATDDLVITYQDLQKAQDKREELTQAETEALEAQAQAIRDLTAARGDYFTAAIGGEGLAWWKEDQVGTAGIDESAISDELYKQADAAGASAEVLAMLKLATGELSDKQAIAALKTAAVTEKIKMMGEALADPTSGVTPAEAVSNIQNFIDGLGEVDFEIGIHPEYATGDEFDRGFQEKMKGLFDVDGEGGPATFTVNADTGDAADDIESFFMNDVGPYFEEPYKAEIQTEIETAMANAQLIIDKLHNIPTQINVKVNVSEKSMKTSNEDPWLGGIEEGD